MVMVETASPLLKMLIPRPVFVSLKLRSAVTVMAPPVVLEFTMRRPSPLLSSKVLSLIVTVFPDPPARGLSALIVLSALM